VLVDLERDVTVATRHSARACHARADADRSVGLHPCADDLVLPPAVPVEVLDRCDDALRPPIDLDAVDDGIYVPFSCADS
jgi:hypothetical protein